MDWLVTTDYDLARQVLHRGVAAVFVIAFLTTALQFPALAGSKGLLPAPRLLEVVSFRRVPSLFHLHYSDRLLRVVCAAGVVIALALVAGLPQRGPWWLPAAAFLVLWGAYLSIVSIGRTFYGFGWESLLLEAGFVVAFLGSDRTGVPWPTLVFVWWLVFRLEFGAGLIKMRGDTAWRDLTALMYHHETQPMPGPLSRWAHALPMPFHRLEVLGNHVAQLVVPFALFVPGPVGTTAALVMILTQGWLVLTGNFAWLNVLTIVLAVSALHDGTVAALTGTAALDGGPAAAPLAFAVVVLVVVGALVVLSWWPARNLLSRDQLMNASFNPLHLVNAYGAFGSVSRERYEVVVEATADDDPTSAERHEYEFPGKPGDPRRRARQIAPWHHRLGWMLWFVPLGRTAPGWFSVLLARLLQADPATLRLVSHDPMAGHRPRWIRARLWHYRFTTAEERRESGEWWHRRPVGTLVPASRLPEDDRASSPDD
jgi:hypothetical protein